MEKPQNTSDSELETLKHLNESLASNPEISEHNKRVLESFFRRQQASGTKRVTLRTYSSRFNTLLPNIDFKLDEADREDLTQLYGKINSDRITSQNGDKLGDYSKNKFGKVLSKFYRGFIKKEGRGYNPGPDGPELLEDLKVDVDISKDVDPENQAFPEDVKKVASEGESLRDRALILFGWATGARIGELVNTQTNERPLKWKDLDFKQDKLWVHLSGKESGGNEKQERRIPVKISKTTMERLRNTTGASADDPVFQKMNRTTKCPRDGKSVSIIEGGEHTGQGKRKYECEICDWQGYRDEADVTREALTRNAVARIIEKLVEDAGLKNEFEVNPHDFFRKSRVLHKDRIGWTEKQLRDFFGWSENSDAPQHYRSVSARGMEKALAEEYDEDLVVDEEVDDEALHPIACEYCRTGNESLNDICRKCGCPLSEDAEEYSSEHQGRDLEETLIDALAEEDPASTKEEAKELLNQPFREVLEEIS